MLINGLFHSKLLYGATLWAGAPQYLKAKVQHLQLEACRIANGIKSLRWSKSRLLDSMKWADVQQLTDQSYGNNCSFNYIQQWTISIGWKDYQTHCSHYRWYHWCYQQYYHRCYHWCYHQWCYQRCYQTPRVLQKMILPPHRSGLEQMLPPQYSLFKMGLAQPMIHCPISVFH